MYTHDALTLHAGPGKTFNPVSTLPKGEAITVLWCNTADWCLVQGSLFQGWAPLAALQRGNGSDASGEQHSTGDADLSVIPPGTAATGTSASAGAGAGVSAGSAGASVSIGRASVSIKVQ